MAWTNIEYAPGWGPLTFPTDVLKARVEGDWVVSPPCLIAATAPDPGSNRKLLTAIQYYRISEPIPVELMPPVNVNGASLARASYNTVYFSGSAVLTGSLYVNHGNRCMYVMAHQTVSLTPGAQQYIAVPDRRWLRAV